MKSKFDVILEQCQEEIKEAKGNELLIDRARSNYESNVLCYTYSIQRHRDLDTDEINWLHENSTWCGDGKKLELQEDNTEMEVEA